MTYEEFLSEFVKRVQNAGQRGMIDHPAISNAVDWASDLISRSDWTPADAEEFLNKALDRLGYRRPLGESIEKSREYIKKAHDNSALMALMALTDKLLSSAKGKSK